MLDLTKKYRSRDGQWRDLTVVENHHGNNINYPLEALVDAASRTFTADGFYYADPQNQPDAHDLIVEAPAGKPDTSNLKKGDVITVELTVSHVLTSGAILTGSDNQNRIRLEDVVAVRKTPPSAPKAGDKVRLRDHIHTVGELLCVDEASKRGFVRHADTSSTFMMDRLEKVE